MKKEANRCHHPTNHFPSTLNLVLSLKISFTVSSNLDMRILLLLFLANFFGGISGTFVGIQCGDNVCARHAVCENGNDTVQSMKCICDMGYAGFPNIACFKTCLTDAGCLGAKNQCVFHDPYFPRYDNTNFFMYNYPYSHQRCLYDCAVDEDCGKNAVCQVEEETSEGTEAEKKCKCENGLGGLPYLQCFSLKLKPLAARSSELDAQQIEVVKCPILPKSEGIKISCLDRDGTEHDCSTGGISGTSAMFSCKTHFIPTNSKIKFYRMKCTSSGKWSKYKTFHCSRSAKFHLYGENESGIPIDLADYYY